MNMRIFLRTYIVIVLLSAYSGTTVLADSTAAEIKNDYIWGSAWGTASLVSGVATAKILVPTIKSHEFIQKNNSSQFSIGGGVS